MEADLLPDDRYAPCPLLYTCASCPYVYLDLAAFFCNVAFVFAFKGLRAGFFLAIIS
jgi:hypothetical protein